MTSITLNMTAPVGRKAILARIGQMTTVTSKVNDYIHVIAMAIMTHAADPANNRDASLAKDLLAGMPASFRRQKMSDWFKAFSPIHVDIEGTKVKVVNEKKRDGTDNPDYVPFDLAAADAMPFFKMADEDPEAKLYDLKAILGMVKALSKRVASKVEKGEVATDDIPLAEQIVRRLGDFKLDIPSKSSNDDVKNNDKPVTEGEQKVA